jgi:hypothetical protein
MCTSCPNGTYPLYIVMTDNWGDGWQGNQATITNCDGSVVADGLTLPGGLKTRADVCLPAGAEGFRVSVNGGQCKGEVGWTVFEEDGTQLARGGSPYDGWAGTCPSTNCTGQWSACDESCTRTYSILSPATGPAGPSCPFVDGDMGSCSSGEGQCGTSCSSSTMCPTGQYCRSGIGAMGSCETCSDASGECGCTDAHSPNFSSTAVQDDGSCHYGERTCVRLVLAGRVTHQRPVLMEAGHVASTLTHKQEAQLMTTWRTRSVLAAIRCKEAATCGDLCV